MHRNWIALFFVFSLGGCASAPKSPSAPSVDPGLSALLDVANEIAASNREANALRSAGNNNSLAVKYDFAVSGLPDIWVSEVTLVNDWNGGLSGFIDVVSRMGGLKAPVVIGSRPPRTILIDIPKGRRTLVEFLADAGFQGGSGVVVSPLLNQDRVQVTFKGN